MKERGIVISVITGKPSLRGKRLRSKDGLTFSQRNRDAVNARTRLIYSLSPEKHREQSARYKKRNREKVRKWVRDGGKRLRDRMRAEMILTFGSKCACCGESESLFLQLDHIHNDGHLERKKQRTTYVAWRRLKLNGWPKDRHQLLCANCNFGKRMNGGICPHVRNRS